MIERYARGGQWTHQGLKLMLSRAVKSSLYMQHSKLVWWTMHNLKTLPIHPHVVQDAETSKASNATALGRHILAVRSSSCMQRHSKLMWGSYTVKDAAHPSPCRSGRRNEQGEQCCSTWAAFAGCPGGTRVAYKGTACWSGTEWVPESGQRLNGVAQEWIVVGNKHNFAVQLDTVPIAADSDTNRQ